jgi:hypothetical protein
MRKHSPVLPVLVAVVLVAAVVLGIAVLRNVTQDKDRAESRAASLPAAAPSTADPTIEIDKGATSPADVASCLTPGFATSADQVDVLYGQVQSTASGTAPVLVLRNQAGDLRLCDAFGGDTPAEAPVPAASQADPVVFVSNGRSAWSCQGTDKVLKSFSMTTWMAVASDVSTVQQRFFVNGVPGAWFTTSAHDGYAHLQSWLEGPEPASSRYAVEYRVLDASGSVVPQKALPTGKKPLPGCTSGGSAEIG